MDDMGCRFETRRCRLQQTLLRGNGGEEKDKNFFISLPVVRTIYLHVVLFIISILKMVILYYF